MTGSGRCAGGVAGPGSFRRGPCARPRIGLVPVLLVFGLLVIGSPIGQSGPLWLHLATADHTSLDQTSVAEDHDHEATGGSAADSHGHEHAPERVAQEEDRTPVGPNAPHAHDGIFHTHAPEPEQNSVPVLSALFRDYLASASHTVWAPAVESERSEPLILSIPALIALPVETPPPRLLS